MGLQSIFLNNRWDLFINSYELDPVFGHLHTAEGLKTTPRSNPKPAPTPTACKKAAPLSMPTVPRRTNLIKNAARTGLSKPISATKSAATR